MDNKLQWYFFAGVLALILILSFLVFQPFLSSLALAIFLAVCFHPIHAKLLLRWKRKKRLAALVVVVMALVVIIVPLTVLASQLVEEARNVYSDLQDDQANALEHSLSVIEAYGSKIIPGLAINVSDYMQTALDWAEAHVGVFVFGTIEGIFQALLVVFLFYYFLYNGEKIKNELIRLSPLPDTYDAKIVTAIKQTVDSVLRGTLFIALIQGVLVGIGLWIFGVSNPVLLGCLAAFSALLPGIGTGVVLIPAVAYLFVGGDMPLALGLALWGAVVVGLVDNILVPLFYGKNIRVHPVFVLLAVLGGLSFFGPFGFIFGPVLLSILIVLLDIYRLAFGVRSR